jgi:hypothetical protein
MTRLELIKKLDVLLEQLERERAFGKIEIEVRGGRGDYLRVTKAEKLNTGENTHDNHKDR